MPRQKCLVGDFFLITLPDGSAIPAQIVELVPDVLNSITVAIFDRRISEQDSMDVIDTLAQMTPLAIQFTTRDLFNNGTWKRIGNTDVQISENQLPYRETETHGWVGARVIGSGVIHDFLRAYFGFRPWDEMQDPDYYTKLLIAPKFPELAYRKNET